MAPVSFWFLVEKPPAPSQVQLIRATTNSFQVKWDEVPTVEGYLLQLHADSPVPSAAGTPGTGVPETSVLSSQGSHHITSCYCLCKGRVDICVSNEYEFVLKNKIMLRDSISFDCSRNTYVIVVENSALMSLCLFWSAV